jgi:ABC-type antimicrobial peptide transport system permease subunit
MTQRKTEIGIRIALGTQRYQVLRLMLFDVLRPAPFGVGFGVAVSAGVTRMMNQSMLFGARPLDLTVYVAVACTLLIVASLASILPAWRVSLMDPMQSLRAE